MIKHDNLIKRRTTPKDVDSVKVRKTKMRTEGKDTQMLERCERDWMRLDDFRQQRARGLRFYSGDQWGDTIVVNGKPMTYRQYLMDQGNVVIQTNQVKNRVDTIAGVMVREKGEPVCHTFDREEQQYGEVVTSALQANCDKNNMTLLYIKWMKEVNLGGLALGYESYDDVSGPTRRLDSWTQYVNPNFFFFESEGTDPRMNDLVLVGRYFYDSFEKVAARFAHCPRDYEVLREIYSNQSDSFKTPNDLSPEEQFEEGELYFMKSADPTLCYVCEVWTLETKARIRLNDLNTGDEEIIDADDETYRAQVRAENKRIQAMAKERGWTEEETPYILGDGYGTTEEERNGFFVDTFWYCRFIAPDGTILWEGESPYPDRGHPFSVCAFPYIDGRLVGYMNDAIDHNIAMNRAVVLHDWLLRSQAKGVTVVPKKIVPKDVSFKKFARSWTSIDEMVFVEIEPGMEKMMPQVFHGAAQTFDIGTLLATYSKLMDNGTPVNGALQGKNPQSGTSGTLYAQMANNASTPIAALMEEFHKFVESVLIKKMKNIVKFYDPDRFAQIAGRIDGIFDNANLNLNEIGDLEYDLKVKESSDTPVHRAVINQDAKEFLMNGLISFEEYLEIADVPYADKILQSRQARQAEMDAAQQSGVPIGSVSEAQAGSASAAAAGITPQPQQPRQPQSPRPPKMPEVPQPF